MKPKVFFAGAGLVWKRQRVLWWIFAFNLLLAFLGTRVLVQNGGTVLNHSLESSRQLVHGFDVSALSQLGELPEDPLRGTRSMFFGPSILFTIFMLFMTGGILATYHSDFRLDSGAFFQSCGHHFWRFVRLLIYFAIAMIPIAILGRIMGRIYDRIDDASISPYPAVKFIVGAIAVLLILLLCVRLWFDMAQVIGAVDDETRMHAALRRAAALVARNFWSLFWLYLRISVIGWVAFAFGLYVWMMVLKPESTTTAFVLGQAMIVVCLGTRLWQRASGVEWYRRYQKGTNVWEPVPSPVEPALPMEEVVARG